MSKITELLHTGVGDLLIKVNNRFDWLAEKTGWNTTVFYVVAIAVAVVIGLWAMRLIKPISALAIGGVGYLAGTEIFQYRIHGKVARLGKICSRRCSRSDSCNPRLEEVSACGSGDLCGCGLLFRFLLFRQ